MNKSILKSLDGMMRREYSEIGRRPELRTQNANLWNEELPCGMSDAWPRPYHLYNEKELRYGQCVNELFKRYQYVDSGNSKTCNKQTVIARKLPPDTIKRVPLNDVVNHPSHYTQGGIECIDALTAATTGLDGIEAVCTANAIKYLWRWKHKNGVEDLKKAQFYINYLIGRLEKEEGDDKRDE